MIYCSFFSNLFRDEQKWEMQKLLWAEKLRELGCGVTDKQAAKNIMKHKKILLVGIFAILSFAAFTTNQVTADSITKPHTFSAGTPAKSSEVNANFDTVYEQVNKIGEVISVGDGSSNAGIGTTSPDVPLHVVRDVDSKIYCERAQLKLLYRDS